jgi:hypothetical protein
MLSLITSLFRYLGFFLFAAWLGLAVAEEPSWLEKAWTAGKNFFSGDSIYDWERDIEQWQREQRQLSEAGKKPQAEVPRWVDQGGKLVVAIPPDDDKNASEKSASTELDREFLRELD